MSAAGAVLLEPATASDDDVKSTSVLFAAYSITAGAILECIGLDAVGDKLDAVVRALCG